MADATKSFGFILLLVGFITIIGGGALVVVAYGTTTTGGSSTTPTTSTTTSSGGTPTASGSSSSSTTSTMTTTQAPNTQSTYITATAGNPQITVDGNPIGAAPIPTVLTWGTHTIGCGAVGGYTVLNPSTNVLQDGTLKSFTCQYTQAATPTTTLSIFVEFCSLTLGRCYPQPGANVQITGGATQLTDSTGYAQFIVPQNAQYTAVWLNSGYGSVSASATCTSTCPTITLKATTSGFNILGIQGFTPDQAMTVGYSIIVFGFLITSMGAILLRRA